MTKIIIGRYIPGSALIYKFDARGKLLVTFLFVFAIFLANNWPTYLVATLYTVLAIMGTGLRAHVFWDGVKPMVLLILFTSALQLFFSTGGIVYFHWWGLWLTSTGIVNAIFIFLRFTLIILISTVMTVTTQPLAISDAMEWLLTPLKWVGLPVAQLALVMSIALRFVPTLFDETLKIMNAQKARGADFNSGGLIKRSKAIAPLIIPLFISSLEIAVDLATAMEARGYQGTSGRTRYRVLSWQKYDLINAGAFVALLILLKVLG